MPVIALALAVPQDRDLPAVVAHDRIGHEDYAPDNVVFLLEIQALEDSSGTSAFHKRFRYILDNF